MLWALSIKLKTTETKWTLLLGQHRHLWHVWRPKVWTLLTIVSIMLISAYEIIVVWKLETFNICLTFLLFSIAASLRGLRVAGKHPALGPRRNVKLIMKHLTLSSVCLMEKVCFFPHVFTWSKSLLGLHMYICYTLISKLLFFFHLTSHWIRLEQNRERLYRHKH